MKRIPIIAILSSAVISSAAFAADQGFYVGGNVGQAKLSTNAKINPATTSTTDYSVLGGYQINKNFAVEAQYISLGNFTGSKGTSHTANGYGTTIVGTLPFNDQWSGYGKLGVANTTYGNAINNTSNVSRTAVTWGLGGQYNVNQQVGVRLGYDKYGIGNSTTGTTTIGVVSAGVVYKF